MVLHLCGSVKAQSILRFALDEAVNKVGTFNRPALRNFLSFDLYLLGENVIPDLFARLAYIRPLFIEFN